MRGYDVDDYHTFLCVKERGSNTNYLIITNKTLNIQFNYRTQGVTYDTYISNLNPFLRININNNTFQYTSGLNIMYALQPVVRTCRGFNKLWR